MDDRLALALAATIDATDAKVSSKEEILARWKEVMIEDLWEEEPESEIAFKMVDSIISQLGAALKDGERYYWAYDTYEPMYETEDDEVSYEDIATVADVIEVKLTPEEAEACDIYYGGDFAKATATVYEDGVVVVDWATHLGYGDCFIPEKLYKPADADPEKQAFDLDF